MTNIYDVPAEAIIKSIANDLKVNKKLVAPEFTLFVKTGCHRERAPQDSDWWYIRMASILRKVYISDKITVNSLRSYYGGKKRRGVKPAKFKRAGGKIIRVCLQELGKLGFVKILDNKKGRALTKEGQQYLDKMSADLFKQLYPGEQPFKTKLKTKQKVNKKIEKKVKAEESVKPKITEMEAQEAK